MLKRWLICRRLKATMRPNPEYRIRRLAQFTPDAERELIMKAIADHCAAGLDWMPM